MHNEFALFFTLLSQYRLAEIVHNMIRNIPSLYRSTMTSRILPRSTSENVWGDSLQFFLQLS
jgi:hypothetical protein